MPQFGTFDGHPRARHQLHSRELLADALGESQIVNRSALDHRRAAEPQPRAHPAIAISKRAQPRQRLRTRVSQRQSAIAEDPRVPRPANRCEAHAVGAVHAGASDNVPRHSTYSPSVSRSSIAITAQQSGRRGIRRQDDIDHWPRSTGCSASTAARRASRDAPMKPPMITTQHGQPHAALARGDRPNAAHAKSRRRLRAMPPPRAESRPSTPQRQAAAPWAARRRVVRHRSGHSTRPQRRGSTTAMAPG